MNGKLEKSQYPLNWLRWLCIVILVTAGVVINSLYSDSPLLYRVIGLAVLAVIASWAAVNTEQGASIWVVLKQSQTEVRKVVWPTKQETTQTAIAVFVFTLVMMVFFWLLDSGLLWLTRQLVG